MFNINISAEVRRQLTLTDCKLLLCDTTNASRAVHAISSTKVQVKFGHISFCVEFLFCICTSWST